MKICLIGPAHPLRGGIAHYNTQLAVELAIRHSVTLISYSRQYPALLFPGRTQLDPSPRPPGLVIEPILDSLNPLSWVRAGRRIADLSPDIVVVHWWNPFFALPIGTALRLVKRRCGGAVVFVCHNVLPHEPFPGTRGLTRFALAPAHAWLVHSNADQRDLASFRLPGRIITIPQPPGRGFGHPIDKATARARLEIPGPTILFFGLIRRYKGLPALLEAMPLVLHQLTCTLLVVGEFYEGRDHCLKLIDELGIARHVRVIDRFVPDHEVSLYFSAADLVVLPYTSATQSGIVPIAYTFERPVVATRVGGLPEAVLDGATGLLVDPNSPPALAEAILRFYREGLDEPYRQRIRQLRTESSWTELSATIEALAAGNPATP